MEVALKETVPAEPDQAEPWVSILVLMEVALKAFIKRF